jgi:hypothetical protein
MSKGIEGSTEGREKWRRGSMRKKREREANVSCLSLKLKTF